MHIQLSSHCLEHHTSFVDRHLLLLITMTLILHRLMSVFADCNSVSYHNIYCASSLVAHSTTVAK